jgi:hypothetical protein
MSFPIASSEYTMSQTQANSRVALPRWVIMAASAAIALHLFALLMLVLGAPSGPWFSPFGRSQATPPKFAEDVTDFLRPWYHRLLSLGYDYHFSKNDPEEQGVYLEAVLKDKSGTEVDRLTFPDPNENIWVQHRQQLLVLGLGDDVPVRVPRGEVIPGETKKGATVTIWDAPEGERIQRKTTMSVLLVPRRDDLYRPSDRSVRLAESYARYLCRKHGVPTVELIRHHRNAVMPESLAPRMLNELPDAWEDVLSSFGDYSIE